MGGQWNSGSDARILQDDGALAWGSNGSVVGACESDGEGVRSDATVAIGDGITDVESSGLSSGEVLIGRMCGIKGPGAVGVDG